MELLVPCLVLVLTLAQSSQGWLSSSETCAMGGYEPNPADCGTYFQCDHGKPLLRQCPDGLHWNSKVKTCDWPSNAGCATKENHLESNFVERDETDCSGQTQQYKPDPTDCSAYYWCIRGKWTLQRCPAGLNWNVANPSCDWPQNAGCNANSGTTEHPPDTTTEVTVTTSSTTTTTTTEEPTTNPPATLPGGPTPGAYKVICYFTGWSTYRQGLGKFTPSQVDESLCTHVIYSFAVLDINEWKIKIADSWMDIDNKYYEQITKLKKSGKKVTIAVGGWNDSEGSRWSNMLREPSRIASFIQSAVDFIKKYNFDGIDLDYEYPVCPWGVCDPQFQTDKSGFTTLVIGLRNALPTPYIVSAAVSCNKNIIDAGYDVSTISKYLDWIGVMDYDIHGNWEKMTGHIAPLYAHPQDTRDYLNVNTSIQHWIKRGATPSKLILGIPMYGNSFTLTDSRQNGLFAPTSGAGERGKFTNQGGILANYEICSQTWDKTVTDPNGRMGPYVVKGNQWVSYDDVPTIVKKTDYIKANGLGGAMVWSLDFDDFGNLCGKGKYPMLNAVQKSLLDSKSSRGPQKRRSSKILFRN